MKTSAKKFWGKDWTPKYVSKFWQGHVERLNINKANKSIFFFTPKITTLCTTVKKKKMQCKQILWEHCLYKQKHMWKVFSVQYVSLFTNNIFFIKSSLTFLFQNKTMVVFEPSRALIK